MVHHLLPIHCFKLLMLGVKGPQGGSSSIPNIPLHRHDLETSRGKEADIKEEYNFYILFFFYMFLCFFHQTLITIVNFFSLLLVHVRFQQRRRQQRQRRRRNRRSTGQSEEPIASFWLKATSYGPQCVAYYEDSLRNHAVTLRKDSGKVMKIISFPLYSRQRITHALTGT